MHQATSKFLCHSHAPATSETIRRCRYKNKACVEIILLLLLFTLF